MNPLKTTVILGAALISLLGTAGAASAQYYYGGDPVSRTMPVPRVYQRPQYRPYVPPYVRPYPGRPLPPYDPSPTFPRGGRTAGYVGAPPYRPGVPPVCRSVRGSGCYGGL